MSTYRDISPDDVDSRDNFASQSAVALETVLLQGGVDDRLAAAPLQAVTCDDDCR
jgi:hypothetical protein